MDSQFSTKPAPSAPALPSRRAVFGLAVGAALGAAGVPAGFAAAKPTSKPAERRSPSRRPQRQKPRFKVVTRTFVSTVPFTIPLAITSEGPANPYPSTIEVRGLRTGTIQDINVALNGLSHTNPYDVQAVLVAPDGRAAVVLMSDVGSGNDITNVTLEFDDQATRLLPYDGQIVSGSFKPTLLGPSPVSDAARLRWFNGLSPNGAWRLYIADTSPGDMGSLAGWSLTIKARVRV
jgi:subtilisin-like proprotein convertase family protein